MKYNVTYIDYQMLSLTCPQRYRPEPEFTKTNDRAHSLHKILANRTIDAFDIADLSASFVALNTNITAGVWGMSNNGLVSDQLRVISVESVRDLIKKQGGKSYLLIITVAIDP